jgi:hypothetical protein
MRPQARRRKLTWWQKTCIMHHPSTADAKKMPDASARHCFDPSPFQVTQEMVISPDTA